MSNASDNSLGQRLRQLFASLVPSLPGAGSTAAPAHPRALATAMLMTEVAWADHDVSSVEVAHMTSAVQRLYGLTAEDARDTVAQAQRAHGAATSVQPFTHALNQQLKREERYEVLVELWRLAYSDDALDKYEDYHVRKIADLLYLSHDEFIAAKRAARALAPAAGEG